ncbi:hypothetical protein NQP46_28670 [Streptomyces albus]|nr:hypothetical protein NQP46_28670 [Streptomyces albus]
MVPSWSGLPQVQLAARAGGAGVADNAFGGTLPTWQNPSFTVTASPAVLNPAAGAGLLPGALGTSGTPVTGMERPVGPLPSGAPAVDTPAARPPAAPLRALPGTASAQGSGGSAPVRPSPGARAAGRPAARRERLRRSSVRFRRGACGHPAASPSARGPRGPQGRGRGRSLRNRPRPGSR